MVDETLGDGRVAEEESDEVVANFRCGKDKQNGVGEALAGISNSLETKQ